LIGRITIVKMDMVSKAIYIFTTTATKMSVVFFTEAEKTILKFTGKHKKHCIAKVFLSKKNRTGGITTDFKTYYRAIVTKTAWY
jgi:hypothetical protein